MFKNKKKDEIIKELNTRIKEYEEKELENELILIEIEKIIENIENGFFMYKISTNSQNHHVEAIKNKLNSLSKSLQTKISSISDVLLSFGISHFESRVDEKIHMTGSYGSLKSSARLIGNNVSELLAMILSSGEKLNIDTAVLSQSASYLSQSANQQAVSLEETAAAIEEISSTITNNTLSIENMYSLTNEVFQSATNGENLANQTTTAMEEINVQVNSINQAISVIDQLAFQTNILSLNAAVEAATAGEAGRGFAVVAQEVRNLANKSAEAAREIKNIVEIATQKANKGKEIANNMIEGYKDLSEKISSTISLISNIKDASKEQEIGIHQINDSVNQLDKATQENARQADQINTLSIEVSELSSRLVQAASFAEYSKQTKDYICDVDLIFLIAKLKNDHIKFKESNFARLGRNQTWQVTSYDECDLGKWIKESERNVEKYTKTKNWQNLKQYHQNIHNSVQTYINEDVKELPSVNLKELAISIEDTTQYIFDELNMVKKNICINDY